MTQNDGFEGGNQTQQLRPVLWKMALGTAIMLFVVILFPLFTGTKTFSHDTLIWSGSFHYYVKSLMDGYFPYWDPYLMTGTYFYPNVSLLGLLDPLVSLGAAASKLFSVSLVTMYNYVLLGRLFVFTMGAFLVYRHITKNPLAAVLAASALLFVMVPSYSIQNGMVDDAVYAPLTLYFLILLLDQPTGPRRYLYLVAIALLSGIAMNIYIPAYFLFNLAGFLAVWMIVHRGRVRELANAVVEKKFLMFGAVCALLVLLMAAPPAAVMLKDATGNGELFPLVRIIQKTGFLKLVASDYSFNSLASQFTDYRGVFSSFGNLAGLLYNNVGNAIPFFQDRGYLAENYAYFGIIPFLMSLLALLFGTSRYRKIAVSMLVLIGINMISIDGMQSKYNLLQRFFNLIFPPLRLIEVRQNFGGYFMFYFCMLSAIGFAGVFDRRTLAAWMLKRRFLPGVVILSVAVLGAKSAITGLLAQKVLAASWMDGVVIIQLLAFPAFFLLYRKKRVSYVALSLLICLAVYADAAVTLRGNVDSTLRYSEILRTLVDRPGGFSPNAFQYFRKPLAAAPGPAFGESMMNEKGILTYGNNHTIFCTKRYYDVYTHLPTANILALGGAILPIVEFYPENSAVTSPDKHWLLDHLAKADDGTLMRNLFLESPRQSDRPAAGTDIRPLSEYQKLDELNYAGYRTGDVDAFYARNERLMDFARNNLIHLLNMPEASLLVTAFSPNRITIRVQNRIDGYLLYADGWSRYWKAYDQGKRIPLLIANYNSKAVFLPEGDHQITFVFDPVPYKAALVLYGTGFLVSSLLIVMLALQARRRRHEAAGAEERK